LTSGGNNFTDFSGTHWPSYTNLTRIAWTYTGCASMNTSYIMAFESYRLTDRHTQRQTRPKL